MNKYIVYFGYLLSGLYVFWGVISILIYGLSYLEYSSPLIPNYVIHNMNSSWLINGITYLLLGSISIYGVRQLKPLIILAMSAILILAISLKVNHLTSS